MLAGNNGSAQSQLTLLPALQTVRTIGKFSTIDTLTKSARFPGIISPRS